MPAHIGVSSNAKDFGTFEGARHAAEYRARLRASIEVLNTFVARAEYPNGAEPLIRAEGDEAPRPATSEDVAAVKNHREQLEEAPGSARNESAKRRESGGRGPTDHRSRAHRQGGGLNP